MSRKASTASVWVLMFCAMALLSCAGTRPKDLGVSDSGLRKCPASPNCVCSEETAGSQFVQPLMLEGDSTEAWRTVKRVVAEMPRTRIVSEDSGYLHAEARSALLGFVDDLELYLRPSLGRIEIRSASRLGWSDMGVNRQRVEALRDLLVDAGIVGHASPDGNGVGL